MISGSLRRRCLMLRELTRMPQAVCQKITVNKIVTFLTRDESFRRYQRLGRRRSPASDGGNSFVQAYNRLALRPNSSPSHILHFRSPRNALPSRSTPELG